MADERKMADDVAGLVEGAFMLGLGVLGTTRDKMTELTDDLIERGRMSRSEATSVADRMTEAAGEQQATIKRTVAEEIRKALVAAGVPTRAEVDALRVDVEALRAEIALLRVSGTE